MKAKYFDRRIESDMSIRGTVEVSGNKYSVWALLFDEPSEYGVNNGRVSKLTIKADWLKKYYKNGVIYDYDRNRWNTSKDFNHVLSFVVENLEQQPKKFVESNSL